MLPRLHGCCGGAVALIFSVFTQLHRPGFNSELKNLFNKSEERQNLWFYKNSVLFALQICGDDVNLETKGLSVVLASCCNNYPMLLSVNQPQN